MTAAPDERRRQARGRSGSGGSGGSGHVGRGRDTPAPAGSGGDGTGEEPEVWCDTCQAMVAVGDLDQDDRCPTCGERVGPRTVPLKFKLMIAATAIYLAYRAFQGVTWIVHHV
ncbi:MAG: hypothetical protein M0Z63_12680 [Actinomycetota bacterium]|nr:hypothetical protein [Actinomycetota bacterium]MDA8281248.1 hypothetical protein [Actinomycetota bacterium]